MNDKDTTLIPDEDTPPLAEKLRPIAGQRHHPGWTANLMAHADASIEVEPERLPVTGELVDRATWERLWPRFVAVYPGYADYLARCAPRRPRMFRLRPHPAP